MEHSFYMPVSAIRGLFSQLLTVPLYRQPNTLGRPFLDSPIEPADPWGSAAFLPLHNLLMLLPNFMPSSVQELLQPFQLNGTHFYNLAAFSHLQQKGILPGTRSDDMTTYMTGPLNGRSGPHQAILSSHLSTTRSLIVGKCFSTLGGISSNQGGFTSLCVQGIFGSGKTYCASLLLVLVSTVLRLPTVLTAEPNLPLATAAETISVLLRDAPEETKAAYARVLQIQQAPGHYGLPACSYSSEG